MMREPFLLTGADGFAGSAIREAAVLSDANVRAASRRPGGADVVIDILRPETLDAAMHGMSTVVHAAGAAHVFRPSSEADDWIRRTNVDGTRNVVAAARRAGVGHVVLVSSVSASNPVDVYGQSKLEGERAAEAEAENAMTLTILRLATVYGEGDRGNVLRLVRAIDRHRFIRIGSGENRKSLIHRLDVGTAVVAAAKARCGGVFNVSAPPVTMSEVVTAIACALGRAVPRLRINPRVATGVARALTALTLRSRRAAAIERTIVKWCSDDVHDASEFCAVFGVTPTVPLVDGIAREVAWYRASLRRG